MFQIISQLFYSISRNWIKILTAFSVFLCILYIYSISNNSNNVFSYIQRVRPRTIYYIETNLFTLNADIISKPSNAMRRIYEQQLFRYSTVPFLPTFQNRRLLLKFNLSSIATQIYGNANNFQGSNRLLQVTCLKKSGNETNFQQNFDLTLRFNVEQLNEQAIHFTFDSKTTVNFPLIISTEPANIRADLVTQIFVQIYRVFSVDTIFSFTYRWLDSNVLNFFQWPLWPLTKTCVEHILKDLSQNRRVSCSTTNILTHVTSQQLFKNERTAMIHWLDVFYKAMDQTTTTKHRRLSSLEIASNPSICTGEFHSWILNYQNWHNDVTSNISNPQWTFEEQRDFIIEQNIRFLLYEPNPSGVADRIVHLMTTYLIAILTKRVFIFDSDWPEFPHIMLASLNYDRESVLPWFRNLDRLNQNLSANDTKYLTSGHYSFSLDRFTKDYDYDRQFKERILIFRAHTGGIVHMMSSKTGVYRKFLTKDLRMRAENMFGCLYHSLLIYRLSILMQITSTDINDNDQLGYTPQQLLQVILSPNFYPIGVQIRIGDFAMGANKIMNLLKFFQNKKRMFESARSFLTCANNLIDRNETFLTDLKQIPIIFLLSDVVNIRREALLRWKLPESCLQSPKNECRNTTDTLPVVANSNAVLHIAYTSQRLLGLRLAMFDIFLLSFCEQHVITHESGFGRLGVFVSLKQRNIYSLSFQGNVSCLNKNASTSLIRSGYKWSGIR